MKRKAFTLTELLVVVVIIGVLSAVVLPKFTKVIETRKTTEAEEMMTAVRTEQEARCSLSKNYTDIEKLGSYRAGKNFSYANNSEGVGIIATARNEKYNLEIPSYADGRVCCSDIEAGACANLNKSYPSCSDLTDTSKTPDYVAGNASCGVPGVEENPEVEPVVIPERTACETPWTDEEKADCRCDSHDNTEKDCPEGYSGKQTRTETCNTASGKYEYTDWDTSACTKTGDDECETYKWEKQDKLFNCVIDWNTYCSLAGTSGNYEALLRESSCGEFGTHFNGDGGGNACSEQPTSNKDMCVSYERHIVPPACSSKGTPSGPVTWGTARMYKASCKPSEPCEHITVANWNMCCMGKTDNVAQCYRKCSRQVKSGNSEDQAKSIEELYGGATASGAYAAAGYDWERLASFRCSEQELDSRNCNNAQCKEGNVGDTCCSGGGPAIQGTWRCIQLDSNTPSENNTEYYWCAKPVECTLSCKGFTKTDPGFIPAAEGELL